MWEDDGDKARVPKDTFYLIIKDIRIGDVVHTQIMSDGDIDSARALILVEGWLEKQKTKYKEHYLKDFG